jgi:NADH:ubiquinone oxidoreductase subunit E
MVHKMSSPQVKDEIDKFVRDLVVKKHFGKTNAIKVLQEVQKKFQYLPQEAINSISKHLNIPLIDTLGVATFYEQFRFTKPGKHTITICEGTACHVKGGADLIEAVERELEIKPGETTEDGLFSSERAACLGCCALAPVAVIDGIIHRNMTPSRLTKIIKKKAEEN